ncbi:MULTISPECIES: homoserine dehydrogenase [unclassified Nesterenkonia]|uniref:homoserine dehydrogenase n=1 Tax=unclassified Nesterenkonia TaxID=2629769 RepID=UPI001F4CCCE4|nr:MULTISPECIES: homoserine dehydrogenase [unclassified Nesterenkonia]MCH8561129.1 homoserine dehydrogenase [Nesterenkonia sp. DZ6]MCH8562570.1 homoserine dehydrogenase [Nesterenkonia sp. YGD6]
MSAARTTAEPLKIGLLGAGNVGSQVARTLVEERALISSRVGAPIKLIGVAVRDVEAPRDWKIPGELLTTDAEALVDEADLIIELMGGLEPAGTLVERALRAGTAVVTGNKALLAVQGGKLSQAAAESGALLRFEAAVGGAIPILRPIQESLSGDRITKVMGIVNGTTNYILDQMDSTGAAFYDALAEAQRLGYAESDPTADVEGHDAAAKAAILGALAFHAPFSIDDVYCEGITSVTSADIEAAAASGYVIKLLAIVEKNDDGAILRVHPTLLPRTHPLASVRGAFNAVFVVAENAGELMFYGQGAGGLPTSSAIMGDVVSVARRLHSGPDNPGTTDTNGDSQTVRALPVDDARTQYYIDMEVADREGVIAEVARVLADHHVSIESMRQPGSVSTDGEVDTEAARERGAVVQIVTHLAKEKHLSDTVSTLRALDVVLAVNSVLRVEVEQ